MLTDGLAVLAAVILVAVGVSATFGIFTVVRDTVALATAVRGSVKVKPVLVAEVMMKVPLYRLGVTPEITTCCPALKVLSAVMVATPFDQLAAVMVDTMPPVGRATEPFGTPSG